MDETIHLALVLHGNPFRQRKTAVLARPRRNRAGNLRRQFADVEGLDCANAGLALDQLVPHAFNAKTKGTRNPHARDNNPPLT